MSVLTDLIYGGSNAVAGLTEGAVQDCNQAKYGADKGARVPRYCLFFPNDLCGHWRQGQDAGGLDRLCRRFEEPDYQPGGSGAGTECRPCHRRWRRNSSKGLKYVEGKDPYEAAGSGIGFVPDPIIRCLGVPLVTGDIPGVAVVLGQGGKRRRT